ncbi:hypothetical protein X275_06825 [Marinitoga sp. 1197]|uniref:UPF0158 family protein n=2 Tax=Marinitoga TaxID=160798 RepID=UPI000640C774|nr:UPF0158 family protein [Marinitoga sp. 1197]KLO21987.1 hypothetical protein X275_06825 [Marinitoga sp. 1197]
MDAQFSETTKYYNKKTGEFVTIENDFLSKAEYDDYDYIYSKAQDWEKEELKLADAILTYPEIYIPIPSQYDIYEYKIMRNFSIYMVDDETSEILLNALNGRGAFRFFKYEISRLGLRDKYYEYKMEKLKEIAIEWCEEHGLEYYEE